MFDVKFGFKSDKKFKELKYVNSNDIISNRQRSQLLKRTLVIT